MKPAAFAYAAPDTLEDALALLEAHQDEAKALAGGQSLMPLINMRLARPGLLVDLNRVRGLAGIRRDAEWLCVGATTRHRRLELHPETRAAVPVLGEALAHVGHLAIRTRGTVGGSLAHADPSAELPLLAVLLDAELALTSAAGERRVPAREFFLTYLTTVLEPSELVREVRFRVPPPTAGWAFAEVTRRRGDFALVAAVVLLELDAQGRVTAPRLAVGGAGPVPLRLQDAEAFLIGRVPRPAVLAEAARLGAAALEPDGDVHASADYRRRVAERLLERLLGQALERVAGRV